MAKSKRKAVRRQTAGTKPPRPSSVRDGGHRRQVRNSGLEVWLYDEANREAIREAGPSDAGFGGMPPRFEEQAREGLTKAWSSPLRATESSTSSS